MKRNNKILRYRGLN
ncbi:hypothetical protein ACVXHB_22575 [Escherichia coli]